MNFRTITRVDWKMMSQRQRMSPLPNYMSMESMMRELLKYVGTTLSSMLLFFEDRVMHAFIAEKEFVAVGKAIVRRIHRDPYLYQRLVKAEDRCGKKFVAACKAMGKTASNASPRQLFALWQRFEERYKEVYAAYGSVWIVEAPLNTELYQILEKRVNDAVRASTILDTLTKQPSAMVARIEREALYKLAAEIVDKRNWEKNAAVMRRIRQHERAFFWLTRDYEDPVLTEEKIVERLRDCLKNDPKKVYAAMVAERKTLAREQKRLTKELALTREERSLFAAMRDAAHLKELRKRYVSEGLFYFDAVLNAIARHSFLTIKQVRFLRTEDVRSLLLRGKDYSHETTARIIRSAWFTHRGATTVFTGKVAQVLYKKEVAVDRHATVFPGLPVSPGIARGPAKIVLDPSQCDKVEKGDIIVSIQVVPSFSSAILRAAGLICDGGHGITSHPAVLAREAGIPAIIQTRFAREVLKDGDLVEVDGYKGIARKLT